MRKKVFFPLLVLAFLLATVLGLSGCAIEQPGSTFVETEGGVALKRYVGNSVEKEYTVDVWEETPVVALLQFSISNAEYLEVLKIGASVIKIDPWALTNCPKLKRIEVDENNPAYSSKDGVLYNKDQTELLVFPIGSLPAIKEYDEKVSYPLNVYKIPDSVTVIGENAFYRCSTIVNMELPKALVTIKDRGFFRIENLRELILPDTLETIGVDGISYCGQLTSMFIPKSVTSIGEYAFVGSSKIAAMQMEHASQEQITVPHINKWLPLVPKEVSKRIPLVWGATR